MRTFVNALHRCQGPALLVLLALVLAGTFLAYLRPDFMLDVANRIMLCF